MHSCCCMISQTAKYMPYTKSIARATDFVVKHGMLVVHGYVSRASSIVPSWMAEATSDSTPPPPPLFPYWLIHGYVCCIASFPHQIVIVCVSFAHFTSAARPQSLPHAHCPRWAKHCGVPGRGRDCSHFILVCVISRAAKNTQSLTSPALPRWAKHCGVPCRGRDRGSCRALAAACGEHQQGDPHGGHDCRAVLPQHRVALAQRE